jgi:uncharacterized protein YkwD
MTAADRNASLLALALLAGWLAGCGGGGDPPPSSGGPTATLPSGTDFTCGLPAFRDEALSLINQHRAAGANCGSAGTFAPTGTVAWNDALTTASFDHSKDMADRNYFDHASADGRVLSDRVNATGYRWWLLGENIAAGYPSVAAVVDGWMKSPGHCRNIMNSGFREIGMACAHNAASTYQLYYTLDLATPR